MTPTNVHCFTDSWKAEASMDGLVSQTDCCYNSFWDTEENGRFPEGCFQFGRFSLIPLQPVVTTCNNSCPVRVVWNSITYANNTLKHKLDGLTKFGMSLKSTYIVWNKGGRFEMLCCKPEDDMTVTDTYTHKTSNDCTNMLSIKLQTNLKYEHTNICKCQQTWKTMSNYNLLQKKWFWSLLTLKILMIIERLQS